MVDVWASIDLKGIAEKLVRGASSVRGDGTVEGNLQKRLWIVLSYLAVARPGEIKFNDMKEWTHHHYIEVLDIFWFELKTMTQYAMPMCPSNFHFLLDFWHSLASYWMEGRLDRTQ